MLESQRERLRSIRTFPSLVKYLRDELDWPIETDDFEDLFFEYDAEELGIDPKTAAKIDSIKQLRPLTSDQPWGIFFVKFEPKRLPVVALRRILGQLVFKKRASADRSERPAWDPHDLLFISAFGEGDERQISFAHFSEDRHLGNLATLRVLGWDGDDTGLHLDHVYRELHDKLRWPNRPDDVCQWRARWSLAFTTRYREVITTSKDLALELADLARRIRRKVNAALRAESETGKLRKLMKAFQQSLIHDLDHDDFADMYSQTIAYGLLSARVSRQSGALAADDVALMVPVTNPFLRELMETFLNVGGRKRKTNGQALDFDELGIAEVVEVLRAANMEAVLRDFDNRNPQEDPVIHFYELFLKEYDAKKRMQRGVFYTPKPVVSYIVRSVHELLQTEFGLADGLADTTTWAQFVDAASSRVPGDAPSPRSSRSDPDASAPAPAERQDSGPGGPKRQDAASTLLGYFDPEEPIADLSGNLPHWRQEGVTYFVTFRLADSMPQAKLRQWLAEREAWLKANPQPHSPAQRRRYHDLFTERFQRWLDQGYGSCVLRRPDVKAVVESALRHFDGTRYVLDEFVVMPNHVHALVTPLGGHELSQILHSWKSFTASQINRLCGMTGPLWQKESFDHIVRSPESMERFRQYVHDNVNAAAASSRATTTTTTTQDAAPTSLPRDSRERPSAEEEEKMRQDAASTFVVPDGVSPEEPFVQILDPACGTGTFLVEVIDTIHRTLLAKWKRHPAACWAMLRDATASSAAAGPGSNKRQDAASTFDDFWNAYVPEHLLPRLYGFELLMAPYAIAHMKIGLKLAETGYRFRSDERARIYLTNSLEPPMPEFRQKQIEEMSVALAHEAKAVDDIKRNKRFTIVVGNPPYSASMCEPDWLMRQLDDWKQGLNETKSDLNREEWKFLRLAQYHCSTTGAGIVGFIINRDFLDGIVKRRMRQHLAESFALRIAVDLNGDVKGNIADENVFEIEQGVAIVVLSTRAARPVLRFASRVGTRAQKYADLLAQKPIDAALTAAQPTAPYYRWVPFSSADASDAGAVYAEWLPLDSVFTLKSSGIQTKNDPICIGWSANEVFERVERLAKLSAAEAGAEFGLERDGVWSLDAAQAEVRAFGVARKNVRRILYRPFDFRFTYYTHKSSGFLGRPRYDVMRHMLDTRNVGLLFNRQIVGESVSHFSVSRDLICHGTFYLGNKGQDYLAPLYLHSHDELLSSASAGEGGATPNFTRTFLAALRTKLGSVAAKLTPEDILHYAYAVFHSPGYRSRYAEFLKIDFPRLPLTSCLELFRALAGLGGGLVALHLMESPKLDRPITHFVGQGAPVVERVGFTVDAASCRISSASAARPARSATAPSPGSPLSPATSASRESPRSPAIRASDANSESQRQDAAATGPESQRQDAAATVGTVWIDAPAARKGQPARPGTIGFKGVPEAVWNFHIGGYQVCQKWLKDRKGRTLSQDDIAHYQKIVVALNETIRIMGEIDEVIDRHGGWPDAFVTEPVQSGEEDPSRPFG